jgi:hypothetical protein
MRKTKDQEEKNSHLNRGVELLLRYQEKKKPELKLFDFIIDRVLFQHRIHFEFFITKPKKFLGKNKC